MSAFQDLTSLEDTECSFEDFEMLLADTGDQTLSQIESLQKLHAALEDIDFETQIKVLNAFALCDDSVKQIIGSDENQYLHNFESFYDAAMEGFWQDLLRWGPLGAIVGRYLESLGRIKKVCLSVKKTGIKEGYLNENSNKYTWPVSLYLPDWQDWEPTVNALNVLFEGLKSAQKNFKAFKPMSMAPALRRCGFVITEREVKGAHTDIDWGAVGGTWLGILVCLGIGALIGASSGSVGLGVAVNYGAYGWVYKMAGGHLGSKNGPPLDERGWDAKKFMKAIDDMLKLVNQAYELDNIKATIEEKTAENAEKAKFLQKCAKVYLEEVKTIGRGLASAAFHLRPLIGR